VLTRNVSIITRLGAGASNVPARITLTSADYVVVIGYFIVVLGIGLWFRKRLTNVGDYFAGGNQVPWWMAGISHYMSSFSAFSFIAYAQIGYMYGWVAVTLFWVSIPACIAGGLIFASRWRRARVITPIQFLETRYNGTLRQLFAWAGIPMKIFDDALKVFATGLFISVASGLTLSWSIVVCGGVMVAYSFFGGLWALVVTDYVQFLMKFLAIVLMVPLAFHASGGIRRGLTGLPSGFFSPVNGPYNWLYIVGFACIMFVSYNASWSLAQKYYSVPDERDASKAAYLSAALNCIGAPLMIVPAILGRHFLPDLAASGQSADTYVLLVMRLLPEGMVGIILAAMLSATMAAVSSDFNAIASVLTEDIYHRLIRSNASQHRLLSMGRWLTLALGSVTTLLSLWIVFSHREALFGLMVIVFGLFMAPTLLPLLMGLTVRWVTARGALLGFICGFVTGIAMLAIKTYWKPASTIVGGPYGFEGLSLITNTFMTLLGIAVGSFFWRRGDQEEQNVERFFEKLNRPVLKDAAVPTAMSNASPILAISTLGVALLIGIAGALSRSHLARLMDSGAALVLLFLALILYFFQRRQVLPKTSNQLD
jgi:solute:Na+ symporter, SSS family